MAVHPPEQVVHDRVNLGRLVRRLEKAVSDDSWDVISQQDAWIKVQGTLQKVKYAKMLLKNVYDANPTPKTSQRYHNFEITLGRIENVVLDLEKRFTPQQARPSPLLPQIPIPLAAATSPKSPGSKTPDGTPLPETEDSSTADIATSPSEDRFLLPADMPTTPRSSTSFSFPSAGLGPSGPSDLPGRPTRGVMPAPAFLQNSSAVQQELSEQLAQMAAQLKRNATHFSETLAKDAVVVEDAKAKIESNFDTMQTQRVKLRDRSAKSSSTTWLVLISILVVVVSFVLMFLVIRVT